MLNLILNAANDTLEVTGMAAAGDAAVSTLTFLPIGTVGGSATGELALKVVTVGSSAAGTGVRAEDTAAASGDTGIGALAVQLAAPANTAADGDYSFLQMSLGRLWVAPNGTVADNAASTANPVLGGGFAVTGSTYAPAYTADDLTVIAVDKDSGGILSHIRALTRADDAISADPKQYATVSTATPATADATVFTLAAGEKGVIQNLSADAPLAYKLGASASTSSFNGVLQCGSAADDGKGGVKVIEDYIGVVSVAKISGTARYIAFKLS